MTHRNRRFRLLWPLVAVSLLLMLLGGQVARGAADNRSLYWERWDTTIDNIVTQSNQFDVTETYVIVVETGPYRFGYREIPMNRLTGISNVQVAEDNAAFSPGCNSAAGTYCARVSGSNYRIDYYFASPAQSGDRRTIDIKYTVSGALRSYSGGDQLYWSALATDRAFPVLASTVIVKMPEGRPAQVIASYPEWPYTTAGNTLTWTSPGSLGTGGNVEVRVQYPHDPQMVVPSWQPGFDRERQLGPILGLCGLAFGALLALAGPVFIYIQYAKHGRDPEVVVVPEYLSEPPSDEAPGVVGTLVDESADMQDIMATLIDLARRGYLVIEQSQAGGIGGLFTHTEFTFHRTDKNASDLRYNYEKTLYTAFFPYGSDSTTLSSLRNKFYTNIPTIKKGLYDVVVKNGYFPRSPDTTRNMWIGIGIGILVLAGVVGYGAYKLLAYLSILTVAPAFGLGITGLATVITASFMPAKTLKGAQDAAKWNAFRNYLKNITKYADIKQATDQFERYIGYAVAFSIDQQWTRQFASVLTSMPTWYYPTYLGGPWGGGYHQHGPMIMGGGMPSGGMNIGGPGSLNDMSQSMANGLNAMSSGLTQMLNDASSAMTSHPSSSGGGFSGGGGGGGGGSGGGGAGFG